MHDTLQILSLEGEDPEQVEIIEANWFKIWWVSISVIFVLEMYLRNRQNNMYYTKHRPENIKALVSKDEFRKCQKYSKAKSQFGMVSHYIQFVWKLVVWTQVWPSTFWNYTAPWTAENVDEAGTLKYDFVQAIMLSFFMICIDCVVSVPLSLFSKFMIEESHGFNKQDFGGFVKDGFKMLLLWAIFEPIQTWTFLWIINKFGIDKFVLYAGIFITVFVAIFMILVPIFIMPLFNKFEAIEDNQLKRDIESLAKDCKYPVSKIEVVDGSKRSGHSNAFQYGFGKIKKIVLFDTLLDQHLGKKDATDQEKENKGGNEPFQLSKIDGEDSSQSEKEEDKKQAAEAKEEKVLKQEEFDYSNEKGRLEILAIVAHELGHWANLDTVKMLVSQLLTIYIIFFVFGFSFEKTDMDKDFGFTDPSVYVKLMLFFVLLEPVNEILHIKQVTFVRSIEFAADKYSVDLGYAKSLKSGLVAIHVNNQANLNPDWLYALFKFDHPALVERLNAIDKHIIAIAQETSNTDSIEQALPIYEEKFRQDMSNRHNQQTINEGGMSEPTQKAKSKEYLGFNKITDEKLI